MTPHQIIGSMTDTKLDGARSTETTEKIKTGKHTHRSSLDMTTIFIMFTVIFGILVIIAAIGYKILAKLRHAGRPNEDQKGELQIVCSHLLAANDK